MKFRLSCLIFYFAWGCLWKAVIPASNFGAFSLASIAKMPSYYVLFPHFRLDFDWWDHLQPLFESWGLNLFHLTSFLAVNWCSSKALYHFDHLFLLVNHLHPIGHGWISNRRFFCFAWDLDRLQFLWTCHLRRHCFLGSWSQGDLGNHHFNFLHFYLMLLACSE